MGGGLESDLSQGAVPALWSPPPASAVWARLSPVLQVADVRHVPDVPRPAPLWYGLLLSDGVHSQHASLAPNLDHLAGDGAIRRGSVIRLRSFVNVPDPDHVRTIFIIRLEILQTECTLIGSLKLYRQPRNSGVLSTSRSMSYGLSRSRNFGVIQMRPSCGTYPSDGDKLSVWKLVGQIKDENLGYSDKPDLITVKATISCVTDLGCHVACPLVVNGKRCNARATGDVDGTWRCNRCGYCFSEPCKYWCFVRIQIQDHTGTASATAYEEDAEEMLGCRAKDLYSLKYKEHNHAQLDDIIRCAVGKQYVFQLKVRLLSSGVKCVVLKSEKVNPSAECHRLLGQINTLLQERSGLSGAMDHQNQRVLMTTTGLSGAMAVQLTPGAVMAISKHANSNGMLQPMLQVVDIQMVNNVKNLSAERFRMVLSDGVYTMQSMLTTANNTRVLDGSIKNGSIIHLQEFTCSTVHNRRIVIVIKLDVLQCECAIIGNPKPYEMRKQPNKQGTNLPANAAQANTGTYSSGPGMLGSSAAPRPLQDVHNVPYDGSYGGYQGMMGPPIGHAVESVPNVASGLSYGTTTAHNNTTNVGVVQSNLQQPSLNSHQNLRFAVPSMAGGSGAPGNTYGQPARSFYQQPPPGHICRTPVSKNDASRLVPVAQLNPYLSTWTIKARVTSKTDLRHYNSNKGAGKVFSFDLLDGQGGEIRARCFNAQADLFFDLILVDKVYLISKGKLSPAQKKLNSLNHEYEIILDMKTSIEECVEDDSNIPRQQYNFRQISEIENIEAGAIVDLIGIVTSVGPSATIIRKDGSESQKRTVQLKDMSVRSMEIILWGKFCDEEGHQLQMLCDSGSNPILSLKGGRVSDFSGRSVVTVSSTQLKVNPDFPVAERLKQWYITVGKNTACISLSCRNYVLKTIAQIKDENLGRSDKPDFITVKGAISHLRTDNFCYPACTMLVNGRLCNKKLINNGDGTWQCDKCDNVLPNCEYRYLLQCRIQDHTGVTYATAFQEAGFEIVGHSADELYNIREEDPERFAEILQGVRRQQFLFKLRVYEETFNDKQRVKCSIMRAEKLDPARQSMLTSSNANLELDRASYSSSMLTSSNVGATGFAHSNWMPTPPSASSHGCGFNGGFGFLG